MCTVPSNLSFENVSISGEGTKRKCKKKISLIGSPSLGHQHASMMARIRIEIVGKKAMPATLYCKAQSLILICNCLVKRTANSDDVRRTAADWLVNGNSSMGFDWKMNNGRSLQCLYHMPFVYPIYIIYPPLYRPINWFCGNATILLGHSMDPPPPPSAPHAPLLSPAPSGGLFESW